MALVIALASPALGQETGPVATSPAPGTTPEQGSTVDFSADAVEYDSEAEVVTAIGRVRMFRDGYHLAADRVIWARTTDEVRAEGNVVIVNPEGDKLVSDGVVLTDELKSGTMSNLLVVLENGSRLAARQGSRTQGVTTLNNAVYSPCPVTTPEGCPRNPSWKITAARVTHDAAQKKVRFYGSQLNLFGLSIPLLPIFSISSDTSNEGYSGILAPSISFFGKNGIELAVPYFWKIAPNRHLTFTPHLYSAELPAMEIEYRHLDTKGAFQIAAFGTYGDREEASSGEPVRGFRGSFSGNGKWQFDPLWSLTSSIRLATDKTVLRRYDISRDDKLRNFVNVERIDLDSYVSIAGWAFQGLRTNDVQKRIPIALPAVDARLRLDPPVLGGKIELQANSLAILRREGQDTQRAFMSARWDARSLTNWGQEVVLTAFGRADAYHTDEAEETVTSLYRGNNGWHFRGIGALAADMRWPLVGPFLGGIQRLTPRVQLVLTPPTKNFSIPNEDSRSVDLEDTNLFALNRFSGYDRWEDSSRLTYGIEWALDRPNLAVRTVVGQSRWINSRPSIFPTGTGLTEKTSDIVGRTRVQLGRLIDFTHRFRLDKDGLAVRRNEIDLTFGSEETYVRAGYLQLDRDISREIEDLRDKEELRFGGRWKFHRYWSVFGATVLNLTDASEDPLSLADGFEPVRHRFGISYEDECLEVGLSYRRDYERIGELDASSKVQLQFSLKGLGR